MTVIVLILKIMGIIVASCLSLILLLLMMILFVPVRYFFTGDFQALPINTQMYVRVSWFLHILSFTGRYQNKEVTTCIRIFGIPLDFFKKRKKKEDQIEAEAPLLKDTKNPIKNESRLDTPEHKESKKNNFLIRGKNIWNKLNHIWTFLTDPLHKSLFYKVLHQLGYLWKHLCPRRIKANLSFSMEDPSYTGWTLGIISLIPAFYKKGVSIQPDFTKEEWWAEGALELKGHLRLYHVLVVIVKLMIDQQVRTILKNRTK
ncbi:MAG: hypothetical protein RR364_09170 [Lachnospiraceae bacterium]